ncbi:hypothetical protein L9F63_004893, partial [Diploptera punctata]
VFNIIYNASGNFANITLCNIIKILQAIIHILLNNTPVHNVHPLAECVTISVVLKLLELRITNFRPRDFYACCAILYCIRMKSTLCTYT